jgi:hypothetical protein
LFAADYRLLFAIRSGIANIRSGTCFSTFVTPQGLFPAGYVVFDMEIHILGDTEVWIVPGASI